MTQLGRILAGLAALNLGLLALGAVTAPTKPPHNTATVRIGLVFDVGGKNDKSFNESAWRGLQRARDELGAGVEFVEPSGGADRETALRALAAKHFDLVIAVGFIFSSDLERVAKDFPTVNFAGVDYSPTSDQGPPGNLLGLRFREHEGSFVMGAIAAQLSTSKIVGFVGGMRIPLIRKFEAGYIAGVAHVCPTCRVLSAYAGSEPKAFADPPLGQELASAQYDQGADIIFHAAGKTGDGVFAAARSRDARAIGVDSDQFANAPCCIITSMLKRVDNAVVAVVKDVIAGKFHGGIVELGLSDGGIDFVSDDHNRVLLPAAEVLQARRLIEQIIAGDIKVPSQ
jgi:basic membrane protein A and related proteins